MSDMQVSTSIKQTLDLSDACDSHNTNLLDIVTWLKTGEL
jgi:hypothetical protein